MQFIQKDRSNSEPRGVITMSPFTPPTNKMSSRNADEDIRSGGAISAIMGCKAG